MKENIMESLHNIGKGLLNLLYPPVCPFCGKIAKEGICPECREKLWYIEEPRCMKCGKPVEREEAEYCPDCQRHSLEFEQGRSLWLHTGIVPQAIYRFKFHNRRYYAEIFARELAEHYGEWIAAKKIDMLIPVPLHLSRKRSRGFNQAELLAKALGQNLNLPVAADAVIRVKKTRPQKQLGGRERQINLKNAFGVRWGWKAPENVLVIDDIYTTGNTVHRVAKVLKKAGVQKVYFLTISIGQGL